MRLSCPNCSTEYEVPDHALVGRARDILCERCGHGWNHAAPSAIGPDISPDGTPALETLAESAPWGGGRTETKMVDSTPPQEPDAYQPHFGTPVDEAAAAALHEATLAEDPTSLSPSDPPDLPAFLNGNTGSAPATPGADRFADLVTAARNNKIELEPDRPRPSQGVRTSNPVMFIILVILLLAALIVLERHEVIRLIPAAGPLFKSWGFK
ncbi:MAG: zinc-ribbon domain-containing protein [Acidocella sp.]|nr:zinc-ribbon domain-containing protein [Acidocella sp.]